MANPVQSRAMKGSALTCDEIDTLWAVAERTQSSHGFSAGDVVRWTGDSAWTEAQADTEANIGVGLALVINVADSNNFTPLHWKKPHEVTLTGHGLGTNPGDKLWLSTGTAGLITATEPTSGITVYLGYRIDANTIMWEPGILA